jgi:hypothetical protein
MTDHSPHQSIMRQGGILVLATVLAGCTALWGQESGYPRNDLASEPPEKAELSDEPLVPERETRYESRDEPLTKRLPRADPQILQQQFVARIRLKFVSDETKSALPRHASVRPTFTDRTHEGFVGYDLLYRRAEVRSYGSPSLWTTRRPDQATAVTSYFQKLAEKTPEDQLPPENVLKFLTKHGETEEGQDADLLLDLVYEPAQLDENSRQQPSYDPNFPYDIEFQIFAASPEVAEERTEGFLTLLEHGFYAPLRQDLKNSQAEYLALIGEQQAQMDKAVDALKNTGQELETLEPYSEASLVDLDTQRRILAVDVAGTKARVTACEELLKKYTTVNAGNRARVEEIEGLKIAAEIELVGLTARMDAIRAFVEEGKRFRELTARKEQWNKVLVAARARHRAYNGTLAALRAAYDGCRLRVFEDTVPIQPVKWTSEAQR